MTQKEKLLFLTKLIDEHNLYPERIIISRMGYGYVITDFDKIVDITDKRMINKLEKYFKEVIVIDIDGAGVVEYAEFDTKEYFLKRKWLTPEQASDYLQISISYLNQLVKEGKIPVYSPNKKIRRFLIDDLDNYIKGKVKQRGRKPSLELSLI